MGFLLVMNYYTFRFTGRFRTAAIQQNVHARVLNLIQYKPTHPVLVESAIELLIIFAQLGQY